MASIGLRFRIARRSSSLPLIAAALLVGACGGDEFTLSSSAQSSAGSGASSAATTGSGGGASTSSATTAAGGASSTSAGTGGNGTGSEDCGNGVDDDADGLVDCLDDDCDHRVCVEAAPVGWNGPITFFYGPSNVDPICDPVWTTPLVAGGGSIDTPSSSCSCSCATPVGAACSKPDVALYTDAACGGSPILLIPNVGPGVCASLLGSAAMIAAVSGVAPTLTSAGACPAVPNHVIPQASWEFDAVLCDGAELGKGCDAAHVCAPKPSPGFPVRHCIYKKGATACPDGPYAFATTVYETIKDTRDCGTCQCDEPSTPKCGGTTELHGDLVCTSTLVTVPHDNSCVPVTPPYMARVYDDGGGPQGGNCNPSGAVLSGGTSPADPVTVCCLPDP